MDNSKNDPAKGPQSSSSSRATALGKPVDSILTVNPETLTIKYRSVGEPEDGGGESHFAVVPFPKRYEDAVSDALKLLGRYMAHPTADQVFLKCLATNAVPEGDGILVWAEFDPANWALAVQPGGHVQVFEKRHQMPSPSQDLFWDGPIYLVFGKTEYSLTAWTKSEQYLMINRPKNYAEAVGRARDAAYKRSNLPQVKPVANPATTLKFYIFDDEHLTRWFAIPPAAATDDALWKEAVPGPLGILGVIAT
ncbi:hypothetical protein GGX14DRAFT_441548, partial [Mycena pura]